MIACHDLHSLPRTNNLIPAGNLHIRTNAINLCIDRVYHLRKKINTMELSCGSILFARVLDAFLSKNGIMDKI